jgi:D-arabinitol dehydrogenase (NADP+)
VTVAAPSAHKLELAAALGARHVVPIDRAAPADAAVALRALTEDGFDVVVDATGAVPVLEQAIPLTRTGGTVFVYGMTAESARWPLPPYEIFRRELTVKGSFAQQFSFDRSLAALRSGALRTEGMITHRFDLDHYSDALAAVADSACVKAVIDLR